MANIPEALECFHLEDLFLTDLQRVYDECVHRVVLLVVVEDEILKEQHG